MKNLFSIFFILIVIVSCKKDDKKTSSNNIYDPTQHFAYIKGTITDSISGEPISGYTLNFNVCTAPQTDSITDGTYLVKVFWYIYPGAPTSCNGKPASVYYTLHDNGGAAVKGWYRNVSLIENDTIYLDLVF